MMLRFKRWRSEYAARSVRKEAAGRRAAGKIRCSTFIGLSGMAIFRKN